MSDINYRKDRDRPPPRRSQNKDPRVNRLHIISTNIARSMVYGPALMHRFRRDTNFLARGRPSD